jgi:hypothetical protein
MQQANTVVVRRPASARVKIAKGVILWLLLFLICFGLGYPTLNRYDPRTAVGTSDSSDYYKLVTSGPSAVEQHTRFRVLGPYLARPFYRLAQGRFGTWNPVFFGLLVANAMFTATAAYLLVMVGYRHVGDYATAMLGATLYLLNFATANIWLAGYVDAGEGCFLMVLTWTLFSDRWWLLPLWGVLGALAKETFVPLSIAYGATWWLVSKRQHLLGFSRGVWVAALAVTGLATVTVFQSVVTGRPFWPWEFAATLDSGTSYLGRNLVSSLLDRNFWYVFGWLLPLGVWRLRRLPRAWVLASSSTVLLGLLLSASASPIGTAGRVTFDIAGPVLSLSVAVLLCGPGGLWTTSSVADRGEECRGINGAT